MRIALLGERRRSPGWHERDLERAATARGVEIVPRDYTSLSALVSRDGASVACEAETLASFEAVLVRAMPRGSLEQVVFRMDALQRAAAAGTVIVNSPKSIECAVDKYLALARLVDADVPVPRTRVSERASDALAAFEELGGDVVVKPIFGSEGRGMLRLVSRELAERSFGTLESIGAVIYQQEFVPHEGEDLRVFVIGGDVLAAMRRHSSASWKTNVAQGAVARHTTVNAREEQLALTATRALDTEIAGVDILEGPAGPCVLEVNAAPGWRALARVSGIDVASAVLEHLERRATRSRK